MLIGAPCSGKSTWIKNNISDDFVILSTDNLIEREAEAMNMTYSEAYDIIDFKSLEKEMFEEMNNAFDNQKDIVLDRTNTSSKQRAKILKKVPENYEKIAVVFNTSLETILDRNIIRAKNTGKNIPIFVIKNMFKNLVKPTEEEGFSEIIEV